MNEPQISRNEGLTRGRQPNCVDSVFALEIEGFAAEAKLSRRETDILTTLLRNITNSDEIAADLGISTYTVNNHLKNIFEKTATSSKTEILACFLRYSADCIRKRGLFIRKPRVLIIDDEALIGEYLVTGLRELGMCAYSTTNPTHAVDMISVYNIDFVICDIRMPFMNGLEVLKAVRKLYRCWPHLVFITGFPGHSLEECLHEGATGFIEKPLNLDKLFRTIMGHLVEAVDEKLKLLEIEVTAPISIDQPIKPPLHHIGFGGIFCHIEASQQTATNIKPGSLINLQLILPEQTYAMPLFGQVVWQRLLQDEQKLPGVGIKILNMPERDYMAFQDWARKHVLTSFIPIGCESPLMLPSSAVSYETVPVMPL